MEHFLEMKKSHLQEETKMCWASHGTSHAPLLCQRRRKRQNLPYFYWKEVEQNSENTSTTKTFPALHSSCSGTAPSWTCPTPVLQFQTPQGFAGSWGVKDKECLTLKAEKLLPWHLNPNWPTATFKYWIGMTAFHRAEQYSLYTAKLFATKKFHGRNGIVLAQIVPFFDRKRTGLGIFRDYNARFPSDLLPLRQGEYLIPEERTLQFCAPWGFSRSTFPASFPSSQSLWQTIPPFTPPWGDWAEEGNSSLLPRITDYSDVWGWFPSKCLFFKNSEKSRPKQAIYFNSWSSR